jgi:hypothetical protein
MTIRFTAQTIWWKGPAPFLYAPMPPEAAAEIRSMAKQLSYGWGAIPVTATMGTTTWTTSLFPRDGTYLVGIKKIVQDAQSVTVGQTVTLDVHFG